MSQNDFTIANQGFPAFRADLNSALQALASNNSGATEPSTMFANMWWYDSANDIMYIRNEDNDAWIKFAELDQANDKFVLSGTLQLDDGTVSAPALTFNSDTNMGIYRGGTDILKLVTAGTDAITIDASQGVTLAGKLDVSSGTIKLDGNYPVGTDNVALGDTALNASLTGGYNTAIGATAMTALTSGSLNVGIGRIALFGNTSGSSNTALGANSLASNTTASNSTAVGYNALTANTTGYGTAIGSTALDANTTGTHNTAIGSTSLSANTTGQYNSALGHQALASNTTASNNVAVGYQAGYSNTTGGVTAVGRLALQSNTTGQENTAFGNVSLQSNTTGANNVAIGASALQLNTTASYNTAVGYTSGFSLTTGSGNTFIGCTDASVGAGYFVTTGSKNTIVGGYNGNQGGLDIRTSSNNIVLSDGDGYPNLIVSPNGYTKLNPKYATGINTTYNYHQIISITNDSAIASFQHYGGTSAYGIFIQFTDVSPDNNTNYFIDCGDSTALRFKVYSDGDVVNHDNSYGAISDIKLKEQITDASSQWDDIKALQVRKYKMKEDVANGDSDAHWRLGLIAQEVETAGMNGLVKTNPDMTKNEDGEMVDSGTTTKSIKYSVLYMKAVKALQEAMERIETLEAKVTALEGE